MPTPLMRSGEALQNSWSQSLYAVARTRARAGSRTLPMLKPAVGNSTAVSIPSASMSASSRSGSATRCPIRPRSRSQPSWGNSSRAEL